MKGRRVRAVGKGVHERREIVSRGARGVQRQGAFDGAQRGLVLLCQDNDDPSSNREGGRIIDVAGDCSPRVKECGAPIRLVQPATSEAPFAAPGELRMRDGIVGVETERLLQKGDGDAGSAWHSRLQVGQRAQKEIVRVEVLRTLSPRTFDLRAPQARLYDANHAISDLILEFKYVLERAVVFVGPCAPVSASTSWAVMRKRSPALRTPPSST